MITPNQIIAEDATEMLSALTRAINAHGTTECVLDLCLARYIGGKEECDKAYDALLKNIETTFNEIERDSIED